MSIPSRNVAFKKPEEPSFLKKFKAKVGYKEPATIEDKRERKDAPENDGAEVEKEDEQPTVVVLKPGDIGPEEYEAYRQSMKDKQDKDEEPLGIPTVEPRPRSDDDSAPSADSASGGKILFKKPTKRKSSESGGGGILDASTNKRPRQGEGEGEKDGRRRRRSSGGETQSKGVKNKSLLSFGDDEEED